MTSGQPAPAGVGLGAAFPAPRSAAGAFRDDINGLRAIAVIGVVLYHYGASLFGGGYAGVDVFFVISGFLMSTIIVRRLEAGRFNVRNFYVARARRIVPALVGLCAALLALGAWTIDPDTYAAIDRAAAASLLFVSDIQYYFEAGYFDVGSMTKWLLHTWSLSVEWQFYLAYPLVLAVAWRLRPSRAALATVVAVIGALSLALCLAAMALKPSAAFFLLPMRAWEMAAGGLVALCTAAPPPGMRRALQLTGLAAILSGMIAFDGLTPWPSYRALLPVIGTCLVISADRRESRLTGNAVLRPIGSWSYAIYIWHWPIAVADRYFETALSLPAKLGLLVVVVAGGGTACTALSRLPRPRLPRLGAAGPAMFALVLAAAVGVVWTNELEARRPAVEPTVAALRSAKADWDFPKHCGGLNKRGVLTPCLVAGTRPGRVLFIGDSEAEAVYGRWGPRGASPSGDHATLFFLTYGGCPILPGVDRREAGYRCSSYLNRMMAAAESGSFDRLVLTSLWTGYFALGTASVCFPMPGACPAAEGDQLRAAMADAVLRLQPLLLTLRAKGTEVVILFTIPYSSYDVPGELLKRLYLRWPVSDVTAIDRAAFLETDELARAPLRELAARTGASILDPVPFLCGPATCPTGDETVRSYYRDSVHIRGSVMRSDRFAFLDALARLPEVPRNERRASGLSRPPPD